MNPKQIHSYLNQAISAAIKNKNLSGTRSASPTAVFHKTLAEIVVDVCKNTLKPRGLDVHVVTEFGVKGAYGNSPANIDVVLAIKETHPNRETTFSDFTGKLSKNQKLSIEQNVQDSQLVVLINFKHFVSSFGKNAFNHAASSNGEALRVLPDHQGVYGKRKGLWINLVANEGEMVKGNLMSLETREPLDTSTSIEQLYCKVGQELKMENMVPLKDLMKTQWLMYDLHPSLVAALSRNCTEDTYRKTMIRLPKEELVGEIKIKQTKELVEKIKSFLPTDYCVTGVINRSCEEIDDSELIVP